MRCCLLLDAALSLDITLTSLQFWKDIYGVFFSDRERRISVKAYKSERAKKNWMWENNLAIDYR